MPINAEMLIKQLEAIHNSSKPWSVRAELAAYIEKLRLALQAKSQESTEAAV